MAPFDLGDPVGVRLSRPRGGWTVDHFAPKRGDNGESLAYGKMWAPSANSRVFCSCSQGTSKATLAWDYFMRTRTCGVWH
jgi:hypothetical protein